MKILVTGGAGFIGSHLVDHFVADGHEVFVVDSFDVFEFPPDYLNPSATYIIKDLRDWTPDARFDEVEAVVHLAAYGGVARAQTEPEAVIGGNAGGTARLISAMRGWPNLKQVVLASSFSVYGSNYRYRLPSTGRFIDGSRREEDLEAGRFEVCDPDTGEKAEIVPIDESATPNPLEGYGASKYMQELAFRGFSQARLTILRFSSVYGERLRVDDGEATIIARLAGWIRAGSRPKLFEDGLQIRDWVFVGDVVEAISRLVEGREAPPVINVCSGAPNTLLGACEVLQDVLKVECPPEVVGGFRAGDMRHCLGETSRLEALLGRRPLSFAEAAERAFGSLRA